MIDRMYVSVFCKRIFQNQWVACVHLKPKEKPESDEEFLERKGWKVVE